MPYISGEVAVSTVVNGLMVSTVNDLCHCV